MRTRDDIEMLEEKILASYAMKSKLSAGRIHSETPHEVRTCYQRDRDRVVHSEAFRKLEYKTQVFVIFEGDYYRTRLTHTIEVAQIARTIGRNLRLNEDLIEAIALAHDVGHPPFGHAGEDVLNEIMSVSGKRLEFNHNKRSFDIVTKFEKRHPEFNGLNLTKEVLVGILKHQSLFDRPGTSDIDVHKHVTLEAQVVDLADSLAYLNHDIDDGLTSGCIVSEDLIESELWQRTLKRIEQVIGVKDREMLKYQIVKELINVQMKDLLIATDSRLNELNILSLDDVRKSKEPIIRFSEQMTDDRNHLQEILNKKLYHHYRVERMTTKAKRIINDLFATYKANPTQLPYSVYQRDKKYDQKEEYEIICNYIASMTDRFALDEHKKLFSPYEKV